MHIDIRRQPQPLPPIMPIDQVVIELTPAEARELRNAIGQMRGLVPQIFLTMYDSLAPVPGL